MNIDDAFPSNYLRVDDLGSMRVKVRVVRVTLEDFGKDRKPILWFHGKTKGLLLNKTRAQILKSLWGSETEVWTGKEAVLFVATVIFNGAATPSIQIQPVIDESAAAPGNENF